jgi:hypothetical protein
LRFYVGLHHPSDAGRFARSMVSLNALRERKSDFKPQAWILDSAAFTEITKHGRHRMSPAEYAATARRWQRCGQLDAAVIQDWMCEPFVRERTGLTTRDHQALTTDSWYTLRRIAPDVPWMPVLQGYEPQEYAQHVLNYGGLPEGGWVGVGGVCKRNKQPGEIERVLLAIKAVRPDLRLHGFGIKMTALQSGLVRYLLWSADSMAWSFAARKAGRNGNHWTEAQRFVAAVESAPIRACSLWTEAR